MGFILRIRIILAGAVVVAVVVGPLVLPLLSKVGTLGKNIINTFDLLTGEWLGAAATEQPQRTSLELC